MRMFAFLLAGLVLAALLVTALHPQKPAVENRAITRTVHPLAGIGDIFRGH
ncbi:amino acid permease [Pseudomonas sp. MPR-ANC1]|nr:amino acid permease [Pseudomonas sp. MPR-ANC1]